MKLLRKIVRYLYKKLGCEYDNVQVQIPNGPIIECTISTPQFKSNGDFVMFQQRGKFYKEELEFYPESNLIGLLRGCHKVHFQSFEDFCKSVVRVY